MKLNLSNQNLFIMLYFNTAISSSNTSVYHSPYSYSRIPPPRPSPRILNSIISQLNFPAVYSSITMPYLQAGFYFYEGNMLFNSPTFQDLPQNFQSYGFQQHHSYSNSSNINYQQDRAAKRYSDLYPRINPPIEIRDINRQTFYDKSTLKSNKNNNIGRNSPGATPENSEPIHSSILSEQGPIQECEYIKSYIHVIIKFKDSNYIFCLEEIKKEFLDEIYNEAIKKPGFPDELKNAYYKPKFFCLYASMKTFKAKGDNTKFNKSYYLNLQKEINRLFKFSNTKCYEITAVYFLYFEEDFIKSNFLKIYHLRIGIFNLIISQLTPFCSSYPVEYFNRVSEMYSSFITNSLKDIQEIMNKLEPLLDEFISKLQEINSKANPSILKDEINNCSDSIERALVKTIFKNYYSHRIKEDNHFFKILCALAIFPRSLIPKKDEFIKKAVIFLNHSNASVFFNSFFWEFLLASIGFYNGVFDSENLENLENFKMLLDFIIIIKNNVKKAKRFPKSPPEYLNNFFKWAEKNISSIKDVDNAKIMNFIEFLNSKNKMS